MQHKSITTQEKLAFSRLEFCEMHDICLATYFNLKARGDAPREMKVGKRVMISWEAAADWRRAHERESVAANEAPKQRASLENLES